MLEGGTDVADATTPPAWVSELTDVSEDVRGEDLLVETSKLVPPKAVGATLVTFVLGSAVDTMTQTAPSLTAGAPQAWLGPAGAKGAFSCLSLLPAYGEPET